MPKCTVWGARWAQGRHCCIRWRGQASRWCSRCLCSQGYNQSHCPGLGEAIADYSGGPAGGGASLGTVSERYTGCGVLILPIWIRVWFLSFHAVVAFELLRFIVPGNSIVWESLLLLLWVSQPVSSLLSSCFLDIIPLFETISAFLQFLRLFLSGFTRVLAAKKLQQQSGSHLHLSFLPCLKNILFV